MLNNLFSKCDFAPKARETNTKASVNTNNNSVRGMFMTLKSTNDLEILLPNTTSRLASSSNLQFADGNSILMHKTSTESGQEPRLVNFNTYLNYIDRAFSCYRAKPKCNFSSSCAMDPQCEHDCSRSCGFVFWR